MGKEPGSGIRTPHATDLLLQGAQPFLNAFFPDRVILKFLLQLPSFPEEKADRNFEDFRNILQGFDLQRLFLQGSRKPGLGHADPTRKLLQGQTALPTILFYGFLDQNLIENRIFVLQSVEKPSFLTVFFV